MTRDESLDPVATAPGSDTPLRPLTHDASRHQN